MIYSAQLHSPPNEQAAQYLAGWQRARAELDNARRRMQESRESDRARIQREFLRELLPLADNFQAVVSHVPDDQKGNPWADGVLHVARQFEQLLADFGILPIKALGRPFNPAEHDAIESVRQRGASSGQVVEVIQQGYTFRDEILRPAKVKVAA
jgi:molecular chaperone GrpE